jgi:hypothetical protein
MPGDAWFVTMHTRTPVFKNAEAFRDVEIEAFMDAARSVIDDGGWLVRIGSAKKPPKPIMKGLIDYTQSPRMSAQMDIFLMAGAILFLGSGIWSCNNRGGIWSPSCSDKLSPHSDPVSIATDAVYSATNAIFGRQRPCTL